MNILQSLLLIAPFAYSILVSIVLSMIIGHKKFTINLKNFYKIILCYLPIIILAIIIAIFLPNSTTEGSLVVVKVLEFILPFIWIILPICAQRFYNQEQKMQQLVGRIEQLESNGRNHEES